MEPTVIDKRVLGHLDALEAAISWLGDCQTAFTHRKQFECDWESPSHTLCVTPLERNRTVHSWDDIQTHIQGIFMSNGEGEVETLDQSNR